MRVSEIEWNTLCGCGSDDGCGRYMAEIAVPGGALLIRTSLDENDDVYHVAQRNVDPTRAFSSTAMTASDLEPLLPVAQELPPPPVLVK